MTESESDSVIKPHSCGSFTNLKSSLEFRLTEQGRLIGFIKPSKALYC
jgi:hypothetical protein